MVPISVIVPAYNHARDLPLCLAALAAAAPEGSEILVVDDGSTDGTAAAARRAGIHVVAMPTNQGPAAARNLGARQAEGAILFFVDADVVIRADAIRRVVDLFASHPEIAAVFGSYDAQPRAAGVVSRYRNLLHHFVHQQANVMAATFWAGCGAVRRTAFEAIGGFDAARYARPSIEDIELGYRLRAAGYQIYLDKALQGRHLKRWTLGSMVRTDVQCRALPWARLILERGAPDDLNLRHDQRLSAGLVALVLVGLPLACLRWPIAIVLAGLLAAVVVINRHLYRFLLREGGPAVAGAGIFLHLLYFLYSGLSYAYAWIEFSRRHRRAVGFGHTTEPPPSPGGR